MTPTDDTDNRIRNIFRRLPRANAPGDFEARVAARIARAGAPGRSRFPRLMPAAVPALALLLVGALSYLVYTTHFRYEGGEQASPSDDRSPARAPGTRREEESPAAAPPADRTQENAARETPVRESGERDRPFGRTDRKADENKLAPTAIPRPAPPAVTLPAAKAKATTEPAIRGKVVPGRTLMSEPAGPDTAGTTDSTAVSDTLNADSSKGNVKGLRDTLRNPRPE